MKGWNPETQGALQHAPTEEPKVGGNRAVQRKKTRERNRKREWARLGARKPQEMVRLASLGAAFNLSSMSTLAEVPIYGRLDPSVDKARQAAAHLKKQLLFSPRTPEQIQEIVELAKASHDRPAPNLSPKQQHTVSLNPANIHGIGVGKSASPHSCGRTVIRVHLFSLVHEQPIPNQVQGVPVEIIQSMPPVLMCDLKNQRSYVSHRTRPLQPGSSAAHERNSVGTLGHFCRSNGGQIGFLSCHHVLCPLPGGYNTSSVGDQILQPGPADLGTPPTDLAGHFVYAHPIKPPPEINFVDAAWADIASGIECSPNIPRFGRVNGIGPAEVGLKVGKVGRTTDATTGVIKDIDFGMVVDYQIESVHSAVRFDSQIRVERSAKLKRDNAPFACSGDSGSLLVSLPSYSSGSPQSDVDAIGLLFASSSSGETGFACPIDLVLRALGTDLVF